MTASVERFSPQLLNDFPRLKTLFSGKKEIEQIDALPESTYVRPKGELYMSRWRIAWVIVTTPFIKILSTVAMAIATLLGYFNATTLSKRLHLYSYRLIHHLKCAEHVCLFGRRLLMPILNDYRTDLSYIFSLPPIKRSDILNPLIRKNLNNRLDKIEFDHIGKGLCHGSVLWFNYLFLLALEQSKIGNQTSLYIDFARAIAKLFENGQPSQAALLQSLYESENKLVDLDDFTLQNEPDLKDLPNGVYNLGFNGYEPIGHAVSYIKFQGAQLIFDPNIGLIHIEKPQQLTEHVQLYHKLSKNPTTTVIYQKLRKKLPQI